MGNEINFRGKADMRTHFTRNTYVMSSVIMCIIGLIFIIFPNFSAAVIGTACGVVLIVFGVMRLVGYFTRDIFSFIFQYDLAFGMLMTVIGVLILMNPGNLFGFICIVLGVCFIADGLFKIRISLDAKRLGARRWYLLLATAVMTAIPGLLLLIRPSESSAVLSVLIGISLLCDGIMGLSTVFAASKARKDVKDDVIDVTDYGKDR